MGRSSQDFGVEAMWRSSKDYGVKSMGSSSKVMRSGVCAASKHKQQERMGQSCR